MDFDSEFLKKYEILKCDELTVLNNDRMSVDEKITNKVVTKGELLLQLKAELSLLNARELKIQDELEKTLDVIDTQILVILCNHIIDLIGLMHVLFSIKKDLLSSIINVFQGNLYKCRAVRYFVRRCFVY